MNTKNEKLELDSSARTSGSTIVVRKFSDAIADFVWWDFCEITDRHQVTKRGVSGYRIFGARNTHGKGWSWSAEIDCCWNIDTCKSCNSLREASDYIRRYVYH